MKQEQNLEKQQLHDLAHQINIDVGTFLILNEEGNQQQIEMAQQKIKSDLLKYGPELQKIAGKLGGNFPQLVEDYLNSVDGIAHVHKGWIDEELIFNCFKSSEQLFFALKTAKKAA